MAETMLAAENSGDALSVSSEATNNNPVMEQEEINEEPPTKSVNTVTTPDKRRSVKMIIGGQSENGVAKQVILPVKE